ALTEQRDFTCLAFVGEDHHLVARRRYLGKALDFDRERWPGLGDRLAILVEHGAYTAVAGAGQDDVAPVQGAAANQQAGDRTTTLVESRFDDETLGGRVDGGLEFEHFSLQEDVLEEVVD